MPKVDPASLLKRLTPLLDASGSIKSHREVDKIFGLMSKHSTKLVSVSKCIYLQILRATATKADVLELFLSRGGWELLISWLSEAVTIKNSALLDELLSVLLPMPINLERFMHRNLARVVKSLSKDASLCESTRTLAASTYSKWVPEPKFGPPTANQPPSEDLGADDTFDNTLTNSHDVIESNESDQAVSNQEYALLTRNGKNFLVCVEQVNNQQPVLLDVPPLRTRTCSNLSGHSDIESLNTAHVNVNSVPVPEEVPPPDQGQLIVARKPVKSSEKPRSITVVPEKTKKESHNKKSQLNTLTMKNYSQEKERVLKMKIDEQRKIAEEKKNKANEIAQKLRDLTTQKSLNLEPLQSKEIPEKAGFSEVIFPGPGDVATEITEKKPEGKKIEEPATDRKRVSHPKVKMTMKNRAFSLIEDIADANKRTRELPEPPLLDKPKETENSTTAEIGRKKRLSLDASESSEKRLKANSMVLDEESPGDKIKKFVGLMETSLFMDTLNAITVKTREKRKRRMPRSTEDSKAKSNEKSGDKPIFNFYCETLPDEGVQEEEDLTAHSPSPSEDITTGLKSILRLRHRNRQLKKTVSFHSEPTLKTVHYFEYDETERVNVTRLKTDESPEGVQQPHKNFTEMKQMEKAEEKKLATRRNLFGVQDTMEEEIEWCPPREIDSKSLTDLVIEIESKEVEVQEEREKDQLQAFYFTKHDLPYCPEESEALMKSFEVVPPTQIPIEDMEGLTHVITVQEPLNEPQQTNYETMNMNMGSAFDPTQQRNIWNSASVNPFMVALAAASGVGVGSGVDTWGNQMFPSAMQQQFYQQQQMSQLHPPSLMNSNFTYPYQYEDFNPANRGRGGRGYSSNRGSRPTRRKFSRFDNTNNYNSHERRDYDRSDRHRNDRNSHSDNRGGDFGRIDREQPSTSGVVPQRGRGRGRGRRAVLCKFFALGNCKTGSKCEFLHWGINGSHRGGGNRVDSRERERQTDNVRDRGRQTYDNDRGRDRERRTSDNDGDRERRTSDNDGDRERRTSDNDGDREGQTSDNDRDRDHERQTSDDDDHDSLERQQNLMSPELPEPGLPGEESPK